MIKKCDEIKTDKIKAVLELLDDTDLKIITSIFFEKVTNKAYQLILKTT